MAKILHINDDIKISNANLNLELVVAKVQTENLRNKTNVTITATVPNGYHFVTWLGFDSGGTTQPCTAGGSYYSLPTLTLYTSSIDIDWSIVGNYLIAKD